MKKFLILSLFFFFLFSTSSVDAKKIRQNLKIEKGKNNMVNPKIKIGENLISGIEVNPDDECVFINAKGNEIFFKPDMIKFSGYEKEINSSKESFLITNHCNSTLTGYTIKIIYKDMQDRMLHAVDLTKECDIPSGHTRKIDIPSWDSQHTFYYFLSNEPKKVATPYKVEIKQVSLWFE